MILNEEQKEAIKRYTEEIDCMDRNELYLFLHSFKKQDIDITVKGWIAKTIEDKFDTFLESTPETVVYKEGDFVTFEFEYEDTVLGEWEDNQILTINETHVTFEDIDGVWPIKVIAGLAKDQRDEDDEITSEPKEIDITLPLHPLLTEKNPLVDNSHYLDEKKRAVIQDFEDDYSVNELIAWCRITADKYSKREKGQNESDVHKMNKYLDYRDELRKLQKLGLGEMKATIAWSTANIEWRYS